MNEEQKIAAINIYVYNIAYIEMFLYAFIIQLYLILGE